MHYQGHHTDGSSIQKHSAGGAYPYVLQLRDNPAGGYFHELIGPGIDTALRFNTAAEWEAAVTRLQAVRESEDAWSFENERLHTVADQRQEAIVGAARSLANAWGASRFADLSRAQRVRALLLLGNVRNTLRLPMTQRPLFAELAGHAT